MDRARPTRREQHVATGSRPRSAMWTRAALAMVSVTTSKIPRASSTPASPLPAPCHEIGKGPADVDADPCATGPRVAHRRRPGAVSGDEARAARSSRVAGSSTH